MFTWRNFYIMWITKFNKADTDKNLLLTADELKAYFFFI